VVALGKAFWIVFCLGTFILFLIGLGTIFDLFEVVIFSSPYLGFYLLSIVGFLIGIAARFVAKRLEFKEENAMIHRINKIGLYGNGAIIILFFPPIYFLWGTLVFGP